MTVGAALKKNFLRDVKNTVAPTHLVVAVQLPTGAIEITTNSDRLREKIQYIAETYDGDFQMKHNYEVKIVGYMLV